MDLTVHNISQYMVEDARKYLPEKNPSKPNLNPNSFWEIFPVFFLVEYVKHLVNKFSKQTLLIGKCLTLIVV